MIKIDGVMILTRQNVIFQLYRLPQTLKLDSEWYLTFVSERFLYPTKLMTLQRVRYFI